MVISLIPFLPILSSGNGAQVKAEAFFQRRPRNNYPKKFMHPPVHSPLSSCDKGMNDTYRFEGRANPAIIEFAAETIQAEPGHVFCLVVTVMDLAITTYYSRMAVIDSWGMRIVNPFRRSSYKAFGHEFAQYLPKDLFIFCPARLQMIPETEWMLREA